MRHITGRAALVALALVVSSGAAAQAWPAKPARLVVGYAPGGGMDAISRIVAGKLTEQLGQQFLVENRPGAGSTLAADVVAKAPPDGYTFLAAETGLLIAPAMYPRLPFDVQKGFTPVAGVASLPLAIVVNPSVDARTPQDLVQLLRTSGGRTAYGSPGVGTLQHLAFELFLRQSSVDAVHVPYKGASPMMPDLLSGQIPIGVISVAPALAQARSGKLRTIAVTGAARLPNAPDWPALAETVKGFDAAPRVFVLAPAGLPEPIATRFSEALRTALGAKDVVDALTAQGATAQWAAPADLAKEIGAESRKWTTIARDAGVKPE